MASLLVHKNGRNLEMLPVYNLDELREIVNKCEPRILVEYEDGEKQREIARRELFDRLRNTTIKFPLTFNECENALLCVEREGMTAQQQMEWLGLFIKAWDVVEGMDHNDKALAALSEMLNEFQDAEDLPHICALEQYHEFFEIQADCKIEDQDKVGGKIL